MSRVEVLVEGTSDAPVVREVLNRRFGLTERTDYKIIPHNGIGKLPPSQSLLKQPAVNDLSLLGQLPRKLMGYADRKDVAFIVVLVDADKVPCVDLLNALQSMLANLPKRPRVLFRIAIEETESWFIADISAVKKAFHKADVSNLKKIQPDAICNAWEQLQSAIKAKSKTKEFWAEKISPHLNLDSPYSPSLKKFINGIERELKITS